MKKLLFAAGLMFLLLFGCLQEQPPAEEPAQPEMTCDEYCKQQPHAACDGTWDISGDYPVCVCNYICDEPEEDEPTIANPAAVSCDEKGYEYTLEDSTGYCSYNGAECEEWALYRMECCLQDSDCAEKDCTVGTATCEGNACVCPEVDITPPVATDKTLEQLLDDGVDGINDEFYSQIESGTYNITSHKWLKTGENDPDSVTIGGDAGVTADILFNGQELTGIVAFGAKTFEQTDGPEEEARALAIFTDSPALLSSLYESEGSSLTILYKAPTPDVLMEECTVTGFERYSQMEHDNRVLEYYTFTCEEFSRQEE